MKRTKEIKLFMIHYLRIKIRHSSNWRFILSMLVTLCMIYSADYARQRLYDHNKWNKTWDSLLDGKWKHMMDKPHLSYTYWQNRMRDGMPPVSEYILETQAMSSPAALTVDGAKRAVPGDDEYNAGTYNDNTLSLPMLTPFSNAETGWIGFLVMRLSNSN